MTISYPYSLLPLGGLVQVTVVSSLTDPTIFWYVDGVFHSRTTSLTQVFSVESGEQVEVEAIDTTTPDSFDVEANAPTAYPARRTLWWTRPTDSDLALFRVKQQRASEGYSTVAEVPVSEAWDYRVLTPRLDDLTTYDWQVLPVDAAGNEGTALALGPEQIVRKPDGVNFSATYVPASGYVTITEV